MRIIRYQHPRTFAARPAFLSPWAGFEEMDRVMRETFADLLPPAATPATLDRPSVDLYEDKDSFHLRVELPGLKRDDIHVEMGDGVVTVSGTRRTFAENGEAQRTSEFARSVSVPARVQEDKVAAKYEDGVLTVSLPKAEEIKPKRIAVQVK